jgi:outer membrane protein TolC
MREREAIAGYLPQVNGTVTADNNLKRQTSVLNMSGSPLFPSGGQTIILQMGATYNTSPVVQWDQTIFDQAALIGIKAAKPNKDLADLNFQSNEQSLIYNIAYSYYQVFVFDQYLHLLQTNKSKYEQLLQISDLQYQKGVVRKVDHDRIQVNLSNTLSEISLAEQNLELAKTRLKNVMGLPFEENIILADTAMLKNQSINGAEAPAFNAPGRVDYKLQETQIDLYNLEMKRIRGTGMPKLTGYARYGTFFLGNNLGDSFKKRYDYSAIGLRLSVPIFDGLKRNSQYKQARIDWINAQENLYLNKRNYEVDYTNAVTSLKKSYSSLLNNERNLALSSDVYQTTTISYQQGVASLSDLLNAESSYKEAQINYINSLLNYYIAKLDIEKSNGTLKNFASTL